MRKDNTTLPQMPSGKLARGNAEGAMPQPFQEFPKAVYCMDGSHNLVNNRQEQEALGPYWFEHPDKAAAALRSLPVAELPAMLKQSKNPKCVDGIYKERFYAALEPERKQLLTQYRDNFPDFCESDWVKLHLHLLAPVSQPPKLEEPKLNHVQQLKGRDHRIYEVIQKGSKGRKYCQELENAHIRPPKKWISKGCPSKYPQAYVGTDKRWPQRINDEKSKVKRKAEAAIASR